MPVMPRAKTKATAIAYQILGVPDNLKKTVRSPRKKKVNQQLIFQETQRVR